MYLAHYLLPKSLWLYGAGAFFAAAVALGLLLRGDRRLRALLITLFAGAGLCVSFLSFSIKNLPAAELSGFEGELSALVTDYPRVFDEYGYSSAELRLETEGVPRLKALLYSYDYDISELKPGDEIAVRARLRPADVRAGESYDRYNADGIYLLASATAQPCVTGRSAFSFLYFPKTLARLIEQSAERVFSYDTAPLLTALLTGDKEQLYADEQLYANMSAAGILHVVAVSGMHVAFLVGFVRSLIRKKRLSAVVAIIIVWLFVPVAGASPSVVRAAFMQTTLLTAPLLRRENDAVTSLSAILAALLLINPDACASVSLQLSFAAMLGIITVTPRVYLRIDRALPEAGKKKSGLFKRAGVSALRGAGASLAATLGALTFSAPVAALHFGSTSLVGILVNMLIFWAVSLCFTLGYTACLLGLICLPLGKILGAIVSLFARLIITAVNAAAALPYGLIYTEGTAFGWWLLLVYAIVLLCWVLRRRKGFRPVLPICLALCSLCSLIIISELRLGSSPAQITVLDVGQGQCIAATDGRAAVVIDCGGKNGRKNAGELAAAKLLGQGRRELDLLALTHLDEDHANGVIRLMCRVKVKALMLPEDESGRDSRQKILEYAKRQGTEVYIISKDTICTVGDISLRAYGPDDESELIYLCSFGENDVLITGDAYASAERYFIKTRELPPVEVYIAGHHGSKHSNSGELLSALSARWAVVSSGFNSYGHPAPEALSRMSAAGMEILRTDERGDIALLME